MNVFNNLINSRLHGSYEALEGGQAMDALVDLTGGLAEMYTLESAPPHLYNFLLQASLNGAFITCSRKVSNVKEIIQHFFNLFFVKK